MQPNYVLDQAEWDKLISDTAYYFDDLTLKRGFQYFKQNRVETFSISEPRKMRALVEGREAYHVYISLDQFSRSYCDCPVDGPCKHMAAVLMHYAHAQGRSVALLANAKATANRPKAASPDPADKGNRSALLKKLSGLIPEATVAQWHEYMQLLAAPLDHTVRNPQYTSRALSTIDEAKTGLSPAADRLFRLHTRLFILEKLLQPVLPGAASAALGYSLGYYTAIALSELRTDIFSLLQQPLPLETEPGEWPRVLDTVSHLRQAMLEETRDRSRDQPHLSACYDLLWRHWIVPSADGNALFSEELETLQQTEIGLKAAHSRQALLLAKGRMYFLLGDDQAAWEQLRQASERPGVHPDELLSFFVPLSQAGHWSRLTAWLAEIGPLLTSRLYNLSDYARYWMDAVRQLPESEPLMWDTLSGMLPLSSEIYEELLLQYGKWREWMDYQLASGKIPADFRVTDLQPLEKNAPELLLPFYHQAVERFVLEKNRHSYKSAVKLIKRLAKLYKKLKRDDRWEEFMDAFTSRNSRLRALQEELRKGKLIP
ncbi:SWIM zinc finger family protein [Paenibacillus camerounensis]|uniref:SWIM zinc finger family protein n=1 Tax=Paenibacillus camerounensis TaxID=1243663 RepID=UPI0005AA6832|nr:SWIM zinc finger family protein [Paenibacillus camerounensis]